LKEWLTRVTAEALKQQLKCRHCKGYIQQPAVHETVPWDPQAISSCAKPGEMHIACSKRGVVKPIGQRLPLLSI